MTTDIRNLEPKALWNNFADLNAVPRPSKKEEKVRQFMMNFAEKHDLDALIDPVGNVIIKKPATKGMENRKTIVMQSHLDMVHQKNNDTKFDFETQGIKMYIDGDWVTAEGTTLGADNGLGVAAIMSVLQSDDIAHPSIEALFTIDEETGMTGALGLQAGYLTGEILLNLDTEADNEIAMGCAGGIDITAMKSYSPQSVDSSSQSFKIYVKGLRGGHSGIDIHKGYGNANKIMNRILFALKDEISIAEIDGGSLRNAIPRESNAIIVCENFEKVNAIFKQTSDEIIAEYKSIEANISIGIEPCQAPENILSKSEQENLIKSVYVIHNGVFRMSPDMEGLVETSNNLARVLVKDGEIKILCLTRSATEVGKLDLAHQVEAGLQMGGFNVKLSGSYPGWKPNMESKILKVLQDIYFSVFQSHPDVIAYHAGLECGILGTNYPDMDMISFGPTIQRAHSPDERASISSTQKFWKYLLKILENIPEK
ncbi:MAG TPA: aminoacyl-histidine dipeptidase [Gammaproteobacteria bacterium]|nr:aminoacyl-histidine dipeptidase [Gammaproteobacteria bacterium]HPQ87063.1 aminoacyl-histidine dipeptidase [Gammaproteobacteria bacterium]